MTMTKQEQKKDPEADPWVQKAAKKRREGQKRATKGKKKKQGPESDSAELRKALEEREEEIKKLAEETGYEIVGEQPSSRVVLLARDRTKMRIGVD